MSLGWVVVVGNVHIKLKVFACIMQLFAEISLLAGITEIIGQCT
jgi:hypothetical protein